MEGALVWLVYRRVPGIGRQKLLEVMKAFPDPDQAWQVGVPELAEVTQISLRDAEALVAARRNADFRREAERELERAARAGLRLFYFQGPHYPPLLAHIPSPPPILYQAGPWEPGDRPHVAIVGTRKPTAYGLAVAELLGRELAQLGAVVVSGMARGIDSAAHRGALSVGGTTVAVLGGGADLCYPREAAPLYRAMQDSGAILSEQPPGTQPSPQNFPERNRIISGLSHGVVVVEAGERSGTLITAAHATMQDRELFAVPGPITSPLSQGPHRLIQDGACLVSSAAKVMEELGFLAPTEGPIHRSPRGLNPVEQQLLGWMGSAPCRPDDLSETCGLTIAEVQAGLTMLEIRGAIRRLSDGQYIRVG